MVDVLILGAGGFAKEVYFLLTETKKYNAIGFVHEKEKSTITIGSKEINIYNEDEISNFTNVELVLGTGSPKINEKIISKFGNKYNFPNIFHPSVIADWLNIELGIGNLFTANVVLTTNIKIGSFNVFNLSCTVGHDSTIGNFNVLNPAVNISGGVTIKNTNLLGTNSTILQLLTINNNCTIGAASLVTKDVEDNSIVIGVPAKPILNKKL